MNEALSKLSQFKVISVFDAQTPIKPEHVWLSAFVTHTGEYEWLQTPFGTLNSGSTFIKAIHEVIKPLKNFTVSYVDDMGVGADNISQHVNRLRSYFKTLGEAGITLNIKKCEWAKPEVSFLGRTVGNELIKPDYKRIQAIKYMSNPKSRQELKSILGMLQHYNCFIANYA